MDNVFASYNKQMHTYDLRSTINIQGFFGFCRKLARTKTQQITYKAIKHNGRIVFPGIWYCLRTYQQEWC